MDEMMQKAHNAHMLTVAQRVLDITNACEQYWSASDIATHPSLESVINEYADTPAQAGLLNALLTNGWNDAIRWALATKKVLD